MLRPLRYVKTDFKKASGRPGMGRYAAWGHGGRERGDVSRQALSFSLAGGPDDHREAVVRTLVLQGQGAGEGGGQWSTL